MVLLLLVLREEGKNVNVIILSNFSSELHEVILYMDVYFPHTPSIIIIIVIVEWQ